MTFATLQLQDQLKTIREQLDVYNATRTSTPLIQSAQSWVEFVEGEAANFLQKVINLIEITQGKYKYTPQYVMMGALVLAVLDIAASYPHDAEFLQHSILGKRILNVLGVQSIAELPWKECMTNLRFLDRFMDSFKKESNCPRWYSLKTNIEVHQHILAVLEKLSRCDTLEVETLTSLALKTKLQVVTDAQQSDHNRFFGSIRAYTFHFSLPASAALIQSIFDYFTAHVHTSHFVRLESQSKDLMTNLGLFRQKITEGAMLLELKAIQARYPKEEDILAQCILGKAILEHFSVKKPSDLSDEFMIDRLSHLKAFLSSVPEESWPGNKNTSRLLEQIDSLLTQCRWVELSQPTDEATCSVMTPVPSAA